MRHWTIEDQAAMAWSPLTEAQRRQVMQQVIAERRLPWRFLLSLLAPRFFRKLNRKAGRTLQ